MDSVSRSPAARVAALTVWCVLVASACAAAPLHRELPPGLVRVAGGDLHRPAVRPDADKAWQTLLSDDFEGVFPGETWSVLAYPDRPYWGRWDCWSGASASHSVGCAAAGPGAVACGDPHAVDMYTWMIAGPYDFSDDGITAVELSGIFEVMAATPGDYAYIGVSRDPEGEGFWGEALNGFLFEQTVAMDLTDVSGFGSVVGESEVWVGFLFVSNTDFISYTGAQIDDVRLRVDRPLPNQAPLVHLDAPNGGGVLLAGAQTTIAWTASDPDAGPQPLAIDLEYSLGDGVWHAIAAALGNSGSHAWTVPAQAGDNVRVRVWADDGEDRVGDMSDTSFTIVIPGANELVVGDGVGDSGGTVVLSIALDNEDPVRGLQADLVYNGALAAFGGVVAAGRGAGMTAEGASVGAGRARILLFHDDAQTLGAGSGEVARVTLQLQGPGGTTAVTPESVVLAGPDAERWAHTEQGGSLQVSPPTEVPTVQVTVLKNPGRPRSLHVLVAVIGGSGNAPTVTASGTPLTMTAVGSGAVYSGQVHMATGTTQTVVRAADTNGVGTGTDEVTVDWAQGGRR